MRNKVHRTLILLTSLFLGYNHFEAQIGNYIKNGSFEDRYSCNGPLYHIGLAKYWNSIDSNASTFAGVYASTCNIKVPKNADGFQYPRTGNAYILTGMYCLLPNCGRGYMKNRLASNLKTGIQYCVKFYVSICNESPRGMDGFGIYFGNNSMDTITKCTVPLSFINPQVKNTIGNVISDTLNWTAITGTFIATGNEKYALIGNFLADTAVTTSPIYTQSYPAYWTDVYVDDVSCIEVDLPAYAGLDKSIALGDSVYIGRESDFALDSGCIWYKLPNLTTAIDTTSGIWVKPTSTSTYVVKQTLDCSAEKWDTVIVNLNLTDLFSLRGDEHDLKMFPNPATNYLNLETIYKEDIDVRFTDVLGREVKKLRMKKYAKIDLSDLVKGVYIITVSVNNKTVTKTKLLIE